MSRRALLLLLGAVLGLIASQHYLGDSETSANIGFEITITTQGFDPDSVTISAGQSVHWTNESGQTHSVTADSGLFDSGNIGPDAGFSMTLAVPGVHTY